MFNILFGSLLLVLIMLISSFISYNILFSIVALIYMRKLHCGFKGAFKYCIDHDIFQRLML